MRLAFVLWNGSIGGAETVTASLAAQLNDMHASATIVFVGSPAPLADRLHPDHVPYVSLDFHRGREVLSHPRRFARAVRAAGRDGAVLVERTYLPIALRVGGYSAPIVSVEHGQLLFERTYARGRRLLVRGSRLVSTRLVDAEVGVSDFMVDEMRRGHHASTLRRIYNGIAPAHFMDLSSAPPPPTATFTVGFAGRLVPGKGADHLIESIAALSQFDIDGHLLIAGDGPERSILEQLAAKEGVSNRVDFLGVVDDVAAFWHRCHVAAVPSDVFTESFSMATLEAMACGKPVVATRNGAIPELVLDRVTGLLIEPGDQEQLCEALAAYASSPALRHEHGGAGRARATTHFHIASSAEMYVRLFSSLASHRPHRTHLRADRRDVPMYLSSRN